MRAASGAGIATTTASVSKRALASALARLHAQPARASALDSGRLDTGQDRQARGGGVGDLRERRAREPEQRLGMRPA